MSSWLEVTGLRPHLLSARAGNTDVALAFIGGGPSTAGVIALNETGETGCDVGYIEYNGLLSSDTSTQLVDDAVAFMIAARADGPLRGWRTLRFSGVPALWLDRCQAAGLLVRVVNEQSTFAIDLEAVRASGRDFLTTLSANTRQQLRRARRLYDMIGPLRIEIVAPGADSDAALQELIALHQSRWATRGRPGAFSAPQFERFVRCLAARTNGTGEVEILRVTAGGRTIGILLNLVAGGRVLNYVSGFVAERDNQLKPGLVTHLLAIEAHLAGNAESYDLLAGDARYKASLASPHQSLVWFTAKPKTLGTFIGELGELGRRAGRRAIKILARRGAV